MNGNIITDVTADTLLSQVALKKLDGCRFVTATCLNTANGFEILYHFDKGYQLSSLRLAVTQDQVLPSITSIYLAAVLIENEIKDFFGISFAGLAIDFQGRLLLTETAPRTPMKKQVPGIGVDARTVAGKTQGAST
jgi:NADH:ubiquinone oxidoreductase subunit C